MPLEAPEPASRFGVRILRDGDAATVYCRGRLTSESAPELKSAVKNLLPQVKRITLDLVELAAMDSSGLGTIVGLYVSARSAGAAIEFVHLNKRVRELFGMTNLLSVFESCGQYFTKMP